MSRTPPIQNGNACDERRRTGRIEQEHLTSNLGPVLDLSRGGMRVLATRKHHGEVMVRLDSPVGRLQLPGRVMWNRRLGWRRVEIGVQFTDFQPHTARHLQHIAASHTLTPKWWAA